MSNNDETPSDLIRARDVGGFDVWSLPSFDPHRPEPEPEPVEEVPVEMEEVPLDEVQPLTLEELESIRQEAYNEGFATGEKEGFHSTTLKVRQEADAALSAKLASLERLMGSLFAPIAEQDSQLEKSMVGLVEHISRQVIQRELVLDSSQIESVMREALKLLPWALAMCGCTSTLRISSRSKPCASAMRRLGGLSRMPRCSLAVAGSRPSTVVSTLRSRRALRRSWPSCSTSCTSRCCIRRRPT